MFKRLFEKYLNSYYSNKFIEYILKEINFRFMLDTEVRKHKNGMIEIFAKPYHYNIYTWLFSFHKGDSLNHLVSLRDIEKDFIFKKIEDLGKNDSWRKNEEEVI
jgi:hypothetical protein